MSALVESDNQLFHEMLGEVIAALDESKIEYALMGGIAATALGGHRFTHDIDVFLRQADAETALGRLGSKGFDIVRTDPRWLYKAFKSNVMVDIIFKSSGPVYFDHEMYERSTMTDFHGLNVRTLSPEDLFVIKSRVINEHSLNLDEHCMRHLNDILSLLSVSEMDWDYLIKRARLGPKRVLSLLLYAQSLDLLVPNHVIKVLADMLEICG
jgi:predicted nucleotidyltransferase